MAILQDWMSQEIHYSAFDDFRQGKRVQEVVGCLSKQPGQSVPQAASEHKSQSQSIYRLWANKRVKPEQIRASHRMSVIERVNQHAVVLAIQDTTDVDFTSHPQTSGLGFIIGDREADIFDLFALQRQANSELLIRAEHNRKVQHELDYLIPPSAQAQVMGEMKVEIPRNPERSSRSACLSIKAMTVTIEAPRHHQHRSTYHPIELNVLLVEEVNPLPAVPAIRWLLLTTLPVDTLAQTCQCVRWYSLHWLIERFHYTLKSGCNRAEVSSACVAPSSGCKIEQLQRETQDRLLNALATYWIVAWRLMLLTYRARLHPDESCETVLLTAEWKLLRRQFEPKNRSKQPPTVHQAVGWIARLGGFLAPKNDGEPGLKTIWRGIGILHHLLEGSLLASKT